MGSDTTEIHLLCSHFCSELMLTTIVHNFCSQILLVTFDNFLDAIASQEIAYIQVTTSQSWSHPLSQGSRPFRQSKDVKKGIIEIVAITAIIAITVSMTIAAITTITDMRPITASTSITANCSQYNFYC